MVNLCQLWLIIMHLITVLQKTLPISYNTTEKNRTNYNFFQICILTYVKCFYREHSEVNWGKWECGMGLVGSCWIVMRHLYFSSSPLTLYHATPISYIYTLQ